MKLSVKEYMEHVGLNLMTMRTKKVGQSVPRRGYHVIRFSGSEINDDPSRVACELFDLLQAINPEII